MFPRYDFESEIFPSLNRISLHVRMKLDLTGTRISLNAWLAFSLEERWVLCHFPVAAEEERKSFVSYLDFLSLRYLGERVEVASSLLDPPWENAARVPEAVEASSKEMGNPVTLDEWARWEPHRRYVLFKLAISKNEPEQFHAALREFRRPESGST